MALTGLLTGCATTGDPRQGGLFGWDEGKARERQNERKAHVAGAQAELAGEESRARSLSDEEAATGRRIGAAGEKHQRAEENLRALQAALVAKTERLEAESPTSAGASRARSWRVKVNTVAGQTALPTADRQARLRELEIEIDAALEKATR